MTTVDVTYRIRVKVAHSNDGDQFVSMNEVSDCSEESNGSLQAIRPWDFILALDGSVESPPVSEIERESSGMYPAHYRIPPTSIDSLEQQEQINRQERFAFATLLYEIGSGKKPFEGLSSEEVQHCYSNGEFPDNVRTLSPPLFITILSFWSVEFADIINPPRFTFSRITAAASSYIKKHPYLFALQLTGVLSGTVAAVTPAILGAVGFSALGLVASSAAAGWQASLGIVEAESLFAWCQCAAMGGAAVNAIIATGAAAEGVAALATAVAAGQRETLDVDGLMKKFREVYRGVNSEKSEGRAQQNRQRSDSCEPGEEALQG